MATANPQTTSPTRPHLFQANISLWGWPMPLRERFKCSNIDDGKRSNDLVLKQVPRWLRPLCKVNWE